MLRYLWAAAALHTLIACSSGEKATPERRRFPSEPVRVVTDRDGIPHVYANSDADAFWGQGYMMAELRPSQSEIFRLWSQGRRSEVLGESKFTTDVFVRSLDFTGYADRNWDAFVKGWPELATAFEAFAQGFNARYDLYRKEGWPATLQVLRDAGYEPQPWTGKQVLAVTQLLGFGMAGSPDIKLELTIAKALLGPGVFEDLFRFEKPVTSVPVPGFYDRAAKLPFSAAMQGATRAAAPSPFDALAGDAMGPAVKKTLENIRSLSALRFGGSNNFSVAGKHMADGVAVLESDTHQGVPTPGPYVLFHLTSARGPGAKGKLDIIGSAFPGAPMVVFGHNGKVAMAPTTGFSDVTDFYWETMDPLDPTRVLRPGGVSLPTTRRDEVFKIRQSDGSFRHQSVEMQDIPGFGPILPKEILPLPVPVKISVRWAGAELPGPAAAVYDLSFAQNMEDVFRALRTFNGGTVGFGLATAENRIAYSLWTKHPQRNGAETFKPWFVIPATEGPHWTGFIPFEELPFSIDPARGYLWSANSDPVGNTFDNDPGNDARYLGFAYAIGYRGNRLEQSLSSLTRRGNVTQEELERLQVDRYSQLAEQIIPYFADAMTRGAYPLPAALKPYADAVTRWNRQALPDSYEATIFYTWLHQFVNDMMVDDYLIIDDVSSSNMPIFTPALMYWLRVTRPIINGIDMGTTPFPSRARRNYFDDRSTKNHVETRDELIIEALRKSVAHLKKTFAAGTNGDPAANPDDMTTWQWKRMLYLRNRHTLVDVDKSWEKHDEYRGAGGNVDTINVGQFVSLRKGKLEDRFILTNAPSNRFFWRMDPKGITAKFMAPWGQSEIPGDKHYLDLVDDYMQYRFRNFSYTEAEIEKAAEKVQVIP